MYTRFVLLLKYLRYLVTARYARGHGVHSPFLYAFIRDVLMDRKPMEIFERIERLRHELFKDPRILEVEDLGAGSAYTTSVRRSVASIVRNAAKPPKYGRLLHRMVRYFKPANILEMGTSLGLSTAYMATATSHTTVHTIEGASSIAGVAVENFQKLGISNVRIMEGNFDKVLFPLLNQMSSVDFAFIDGNHRKEPTLRYFRQLMEQRSGQAVFVFDDIHWSREMEAAWEEIKASPEIKLTADLFFVGIVFFHPSFRITQHFRIRF